MRLRQLVLTYACARFLRYAQKPSTLMKRTALPKAKCVYPRREQG